MALLLLVGAALLLSVVALAVYLTRNRQGIFQCGRLVVKFHLSVNKHCLREVWLPSSVARNGQKQVKFYCSSATRKN